MTRTKYITDQQSKELNEYIRNKPDLVTIYEDYNTIVAKLIETHYGLNLSRPNNTKPDFTKIKIDKKLLEKQILTRQQLLDKLHEYILNDDIIREAIIKYNFDKQQNIYINYNIFRTQFNVDDWVKCNVNMICPYQTYLNNPIIDQQKYIELSTKMFYLCLYNVIYYILLNCSDVITRSIYANNVYNELSKNNFENDLFKIYYIIWINSQGILQSKYNEFIINELYSEIYNIYISKFDFKSLEFINKSFPYSVPISYMYNHLQLNNQILINNDDELIDLLKRLIRSNFLFISLDINIKKSTSLNDLNNTTFHKYNSAEVPFSNDFDINDDILSYNYSIDNIYPNMYNEYKYNNNQNDFLYLFQLCQNRYHKSIIYLDTPNVIYNDLDFIVALLFIIDIIPKNDSKLFNSITHILMSNLPNIPTNYIDNFYNAIGYNLATGELDKQVDDFVVGGQTQNYNLFEKMIRLILRISTLITIVAIIICLFRIIKNINHVAHDEPEKVHQLQRKKQLVEVSSMHNAVNKYEIDNPNNLTIYDYVSQDIKNVTTNE